MAGGGDAGDVADAIEDVEGGLGDGVGLDFEGFYFVAAVVGAPFPVVVLGWRIRVDAFGVFGAEEGEEFFGPVDGVGYEVFVADPDVFLAVVGEAGEEGVVGFGPVVGEPAVDGAAGEVGLELAEDHFAQGGDVGVDVAGEDEMAGVGDGGELGVAGGVVEPGGAFEDDDAF